VNSFARVLEIKVDNYVLLRRSLGYAFNSQAATLRAFQDFVKRCRHPGPLTRELAMEYVLSCNVTPNVRARRHGVLRHFAEYLAVFDARTEILDPHALPRCRAIVPARILDDRELARLLAAARNLWPHRPMRGETLYTLLGLLASTGMRSGEALRLDRTDVDLEVGLLRIRHSKFRKDRLVPIHPTTRDALRAYVVARDVAFPLPESPAFFLSRCGRRLSATALGAAFREARARASLDTGVPRALRPHDLRHRFAMTRLVTWRREGVDVQTGLPLLATYLGHARYSDTAYYITATPDLLGVTAFDGGGDAS
jgi:integrase